jgi:hypothetical protein
VLKGLRLTNNLSLGLLYQLNVLSSEEALSGILLHLRVNPPLQPLSLGYAGKLLLR